MSLVTFLVGSTYGTNNSANSILLNEKHLSHIARKHNCIIPYYLPISRRTFYMPLAHLVYRVSIIALSVSPSLRQRNTQRETWISSGSSTDRLLVARGSEAARDRCFAPCCPSTPPNHEVRGSQPFRRPRASREERGCTAAWS